MTYITDQTSAELRAHIRSLQRMRGWSDPVTDRLFKEIVALDKEVAELKAALKTADGGVTRSGRTGTWPGVDT